MKVDDICEGMIFESLAEKSGILTEGQRYIINKDSENSFYIKDDNQNDCYINYDYYIDTSLFKLISNPPPEIELGQTWQWQAEEGGYMIPGVGSIKLEKGSLYLVDDSNIDMLKLISEVRPEWFIFQDQNGTESKNINAIPSTVALPPEVHNNRPVASFDEIMKITNDLCAGGGTKENNLKGLYS